MLLLRLREDRSELLTQFSNAQASVGEEHVLAMGSPKARRRERHELEEGLLRWREPTEVALNLGQAEVEPLQELAGFDLFLGFLDHQVHASSGLSYQPRAIRVIVDHTLVELIRQTCFTQDAHELGDAGQFLVGVAIHVGSLLKTCLPGAVRTGLASELIQDVWMKRPAHRKPARNLKMSLTHCQAIFLAQQMYFNKLCEARMRTDFVKAAEQHGPAIEIKYRINRPHNHG